MTNRAHYDNHIRCHRPIDVEECFALTFEGQLSELQTKLKFG